MHWLRRVGVAVVLLAVFAAGVLAVWQHMGRDRMRAQTPKAPFPYAREEVTVTASDGARLAGTLTVPFGAGPHPAVVLLGVAGPNDRDLTYRGHKGFAVIADALARCGIAALRLDDRGVGGSTGVWLDAPYARLVDDALEARAMLAADTRMDSRRVGLGGLSEGGAIALLGAAASPDVAFAVLMSPPGLRGDLALKEQFERMLAWSPVTPSMADAYRKSFDKFLALARGANGEAGRAALATYLAGEGAALVPSYGFVPPTIEGRVRLFSSAWYRSQLDYDPVPAMRSLNVPVQVVSGTRDQVLPPAAHVPALRTGLAGKSATFTAVEGANHLLMPSWTGLPLEYAQLETTVDPQVLKTLCSWIPR
jgi:uncharacterized protein